MHARTLWLRGLTRFVFVIVCLLVGAVVIVYALPQRKVLQQMEDELQDSKRKEQEANAGRDYKREELRALKEDQEFLELKARDRLDMAREGEKVLRIQKEK